MAAAAPLRALFAIAPDTVFPIVAAPASTGADTPNKERRAAGQLVDTIVLHCTAGTSTAGAVTTLMDPDRGASSHLVIPDDARPGEPDKTVRLVGDDEVAWHCRAVLWQGALGVNSRSLGIEIVNNATTDDPYSDWQVEEAARWCAYWCGKFPIKWIVTHGYLDPERRSDPCATFPWDRFTQKVMAGATPPIARNQPIKVIVNDHRIDADVELVDGSIRGELRPIIEAVGGKIRYDVANRKLYIYG